MGTQGRVALLGHTHVDYGGPRRLRSHGRVGPRRQIWLVAGSVLATTLAPRARCSQDTWAPSRPGPHRDGNCGVRAGGKACGQNKKAVVVLEFVPCVTIPCDQCVHTKTHEFPRQALAQHLFNIYFYIMNIPMHQQCQTQLRISNANPNNSNKFAHAHKGASQTYSIGTQNKKLYQTQVQRTQTNSSMHTRGVAHVQSTRESWDCGAARGSRVRGASASVHLRAVGGVHV